MIFVGDGGRQAAWWRWHPHSSRGPNRISILPVFLTLMLRRRRRWNRHPDGKNERGGKIRRCSSYEELWKMGTEECKDRWMDAKQDHERRYKNKKRRREAGLNNVESIDVVLLGWPVTLPHVTGWQEGALILFYRGLAVTQALFSINKQVQRKMAAVSPPFQGCHSLLTRHLLFFIRE